MEWFGFLSFENFDSRLRNLINESELIEKKFFFYTADIKWNLLYSHINDLSSANLPVVNICATTFFISHRNKNSHTLSLAKSVHEFSIFGNDNGKSIIFGKLMAENGMGKWRRCIEETRLAPI